MQATEYLKEFLLELGFDEWSISTSAYNNYKINNQPAKQIIVYLSHTKLHFICSNEGADCCLMRGGMSTQIKAANVLRFLFKVKWVDPESFDKIETAIKPYTIIKSHI